MASHQAGSDPVLSPAESGRADPEPRPAWNQASQASGRSEGPWQAGRSWLTGTPPEDIPLAQLWGLLPPSPRFVVSASPLARYL